jgi:hypothetical protein
MFIISRVSMRQKGHRLYTLYTKIQSLKALKAIPIECACSTIWLVRIKKWSFISLKALHQRKPRPETGCYFVLVESFMTLPLDGLLLRSEGEYDRFKSNTSGRFRHLWTIWIATLFKRAYGTHMRRTYYRGLQAW